MKYILAIVALSSLVGCASTQNEFTATQIIEMQNTQKRRLQVQLETLKVLSAKATDTDVAKESAYKISIAPSPEFVPTNVWDDGKFTFIELRKPYRGALPSVFLLSEEGKRELVNFKWDEQNSRLEIQRLFERAVLVLGDKSVVVSRS